MIWGNTQWLTLEKSLPRRIVGQHNDIEYQTRRESQRKYTPLPGGTRNLNVRWKVVSIVSLPQHLLSLFPNAFSLSPRNGNSVCLSVPGFFVIGFSYIFWSQDSRDFFLSGFSSLLHLLVKSDHFNRFLTIVIIITIVLITNGFITTVFQQCDVVLFFVLS